MVASADRVRVLWEGTGTSSPITLGAAISGKFFPPPASLDGVTDPPPTWLIEHQGAGINELEIVRGVYTHSVSAIARTEVLLSTNGGIGGSLVNFSAGVKHVSLVLSFDDLAALSFIQSGTPGFLLGFDLDGELASIDPSGFIGGSAPASSLATVASAATNPYVLDASNVGDQNVGKRIRINAGADTVLLELAQDVAVPRFWDLFRHEDSTGPILILGATSSVTIDGVPGVGTSDPVSDAVWATPTGRSGNITSAGSNLEVRAIGSLFEVVTHPTQAANQGIYIVTASSASTLGYTKLSGSNPAAAASANVTLRARGVGARMAPGRASGPLMLPQTNAARYEGETADPIEVGSHVTLAGGATLGADLDMDGFDILNFTVAGSLPTLGGTMTGPIVLGTGGSISDEGPIPASGTLVKATHGGRAVRTTGNVTVPNAAGDVGMGGIIVMGGAHTISFGSATSATLATDDVVTYYVSSTAILLRHLATWASRLPMS